MLTDKLEIVDPDHAFDAADIFEQSLFTIFSDSRNQHGEPGQSVIYKSGSHGDIKLRLCDPDPSENSLFSHFLWNAGLQAAEMITETGEFNVRGSRVLELGAGAGLPGIVSILSGAEEVVLSDYPAAAILDNIRTNVAVNVPSSLRPHASVIGHEWGVLADDLCIGYAGKFDRVIVADCMWMAWQHANLAQTITHLMAKDGVCLAIAGFHTGREKVVGFFEAVEQAGLVVKRMVERDVEGKEREWVVDRGREDPVERKRWCSPASRFRKKSSFADIGEDG